MRKPLALACALLLAVLAAGCGSSGGSEGRKDTTTTAAKATTTTSDDDTSTTEGGGDVTPTNVTADQYVAAFVKGLTTGESDGSDLVLPKAAAECVAPKVVDIITVKTLNEGGVTTDDVSDSFEPGSLGLDQSQGAAITAAFGDCDFDIYAELASALTAGLGDDVQQCTAKNIDHDLADAMLAKTFSTGENDAEFEALLADLQKTCNLPSN
ncbi:MAG: hypothetical protein ACTHN0_14330 [Aquihabitans sp.]